MKCYMPDDVRFKGLEAELVKEVVRDWAGGKAGGKGRPGGVGGGGGGGGGGGRGGVGGVEAADFRSSACFLPPPSMLKGRNHPEGAGDAVLLADDPVAVAPAVSQTQCQEN